MSDWKTSLESLADQVIGRIPYSRVKIWKNMLFHPHQTMGTEISNASVKQAVKDVLSVSIPYSWTVGILVLLLGILLSASKSSSGALYMIEGVVFLISPFSGIIFFVIFEWLKTHFARALGGQGTFEQQIYLTAQATCAIYLASFPFLILSFIPCIGIIFSLFSLITSIYSIYLSVKAIRFVHKLSRFRAIVVWLVPFIVLAILCFILLVVAFGALSQLLNPLHLGRA